MMRMKWPDSAGQEGIVIEHPQCPKLHVFGIVFVSNGEMPAAVKGAVHYFSADLINTFRLTNDYSGFRHGCISDLTCLCPSFSYVCYNTLQETVKLIANSLINLNKSERKPFHSNTENFA
jgi:hypothetical protein